MPFRIESFHQYSYDGSHQQSDFYTSSIRREHNRTPNPRLVQNPRGSYLVEERRPSGRLRAATGPPEGYDGYPDDCSWQGEPRHRPPKYQAGRDDYDGRHGQYNSQDRGRSVSSSLSHSDEYRRGSQRPGRPQRIYDAAAAEGRQRSSRKSDYDRAKGLYEVDADQRRKYEDFLDPDREEIGKEFYKAAMNALRPDGECGRRPKGGVIESYYREVKERDELLRRYVIELFRSPQGNKERLGEEYSREKQDLRRKSFLWGTKTGKQLQVRPSGK